MSPPVCLTVATTDSGGAAGIAADLATFGALGVHGACVIAAVTAQDTTGVRAIHSVPCDVVSAQLDAVLEDLQVAVIKAGMLGSPAAVDALARRLVRVNDPGSGVGTRPVLVVDPVLVATSGAILGDAAVRDAYVRQLLPAATVVTPNLDEARALAAAAGLDPAVDPAKLAEALTEICPAVVLTGGDPRADRLVDWLAVRGEEPLPLRHRAVATDNDHGSGCTYSAALAAHLAHGADLATAAIRAASYVVEQLEISKQWSLGRGRGPVAHIRPTTKEMPA